MDTQLVVELAELRTAESEVSGSNPRVQFLLLEQKPVLYHQWSGMVETCALYRQVGEKNITHGRVFDLAVEQPQLFRK